MIMNNNLLLKITSALFITFVLTSCNKTVPVLTEGEKAVKSEEKIIETADASKKLVPDWYDNPKKDKDCEKDDFVCFTGFGTSPNVQTAKDIAASLAKKDLASYVGGELSSIQKNTIDQAQLGDDVTFKLEFTQVITDINKKVETKGWEMIACTADCSPEGTKLWNAYVLIKYDKYYAKQLLLEEVKKDQELESKARIAKAWQDLEEEINEAEKSN